MRIGHPHTLETRLKISQNHARYWLGKKMSEEHKAKLAHNVWNKGIAWGNEVKQKISNALKGKMIGNKNPFYGKTHSKESLIKMSKAHKGSVCSEEQKRIVSAKLKGRKISDAQKLFLKISRMGSGNPAWKGGKKKRARNGHNSEYRDWRDKIFKRDNYVCQDCGVRGGYLEAHHIKPVCLYPELILDIDNGITYCKTCHRKKGVHNYGKRIKCE